MSYRRKTCESCRKRLDQRCENYWCTECRAEITKGYRETLAESDQWRKEGVSTLESFCRLLERATGKPVDRDEMAREILERQTAQGRA